jgi:hypothetical protein
MVITTETCRIGPWTATVERRPNGLLDLDTVRLTTRDGIPVEVSGPLRCGVIDIVREALGDSPRPPAGAP